MGERTSFGKLLDGRDEEILEPDLPILDSHHHLFERPNLRYMVDDYLADSSAGHNIIGSVYIETRAFVRQDGPEELRPVGEVEFANTVATAAGHSSTSPPKLCAAIVGFADMTLGDRVAATLDASMAAAPDRFRGVRQIAIDHPDDAVLRFLAHRPPPGLLTNSAFRAALYHLQQRKLSFDATVLHHQLPLLATIADDFPDTTIVLNHAGLATDFGGLPKSTADVFRDWREAMHDLACRSNVVCKIGGLGTSYWGFGFHERPAGVSSSELAAVWRPYVESAIEAFGPNRCMMESNYPNDGRSCGFVPLWNAMKTIVRGYSASEKAALFCGTARAVYRIPV